jgi:hypothetical protein
MKPAKSKSKAKGKGAMPVKATATTWDSYDASNKMRGGTPQKKKGK